MAADKEQVTTGAMLAVVAEEGGSESVKLIGDILASEQEWLANMIQAGLEQERDEWKARALNAESRLARIESRLFSLLD